MNSMDAQLVGAIAGALVMGYLVSSLFFFRFWKNSRDRLFLLFGLAFLLLAVQRVVLLFTQADYPVMPYVLRLAAFVTILYAIYDKNRKPARAA